MTREKIVILALFLLAVGVAAGLQLVGGNDSAVARGPMRPSAAGEFRGISLQMQEGGNDHRYEVFVREIAETGANTLSLVLPAHQENCSSTSIFIDSRKIPPPSRIREVIALAHRLELRVVMMPIVLLENGRGNEWRGKIDPTSWDDWWEDYESMILHFARIAAETESEVFVVGSELLSTEKQARRWRDLIQKVRRVYKGRLAYSANWDHYKSIPFWEDLDIVGLTTYYDLTGGGAPSLETLLAKWRKIRDEILAWQQRVQRPILFTEVGWPNQETAAEMPWNYYGAPDKPDPELQARCFEAFFRTWAGRPEVAGFLVWEWRNYSSQKPGPDETGYVPMNKPAMEVIREYFQAPEADPNAEPPASRPRPPRADP